MLNLTLICVNGQPVITQADVDVLMNSGEIIAEPIGVVDAAASDAMNQPQNHQITQSEFADHIEADVLPQWTRIRESIARDQVPDDSKMKALWELMDDYSYSRLSAFRLFDSGARNGRTADFSKARLNLDQ